MIQRLPSLAKGQGRGAAVLRLAAASMVSRVFGVVAGLLSVPLVLHYVGAEGFGIWMAAIALSTFFGVADAGISVGLISPVSNALGRGDDKEISRLMGASLILTAGLAVAFGGLALLAVPRIDWTSVFNLTSVAGGREAGWVVLTFCLGYAVAMPANCIRQARIGLLQGDAANGWEVAGTGAGLIGLFIAVNTGAGLPTIAGIWFGAPILVRTVGAAAFLIGQKGRRYAKGLLTLDPVLARALLTSGGVFLLYTFTQALAVQSDQLLIAHLLGPAEVADYSVVQRLFNQPQVIITVFLSAQWPAYAEAFGRGDHSWIRGHFLKTFSLFAAFGVGICGFLAVFSDPILRLWVGNAVTAEPLVVASMAVCGVMAILANTFAFFYLSLRLHRQVITSQILMAVIKFAVTLYLLPRIGIAGAALGTALGYGFALVLPGLLNMERLFQSAAVRDPRRRVMMVQQGARRNYAYAKQLEEAGRLAVVVTDAAWPEGGPGRGLGWLTRRWRRLAGPVGRRTVRGIPRSRLLSVPSATFAPPLLHRWMHEEYVYALADQSLARAIRSRDWSGVDVVVNYQGNGGSALRWAKARGAGIITDFIITPKNLEIEQAERERWPGWEMEETSPRVLDFYRRRVARILKVSDLYLCPSSTVARDLADIPGFDPNKVRLVPYGVSGVQTVPARTEPGRVLFVGAAGLRKGLPYLAEAARILRRDHPEIDLVVAGHVSETIRNRPEVQALTFLGALDRDAMMGEYARADVFCLPSLAEGSATSVYEALANGLPVVVTPSSGSIVEHGIQGMIIPERSGRAIAEAVVSIVKDREMRERLSTGARKIAAEYGDEACGRRFIDTIEAFIEARDAR